MEFFREVADESLQPATKLNYENRQKSFLQFLELNYFDVCFDANDNNKFYIESVTAEMMHEFLGYCCESKAPNGRMKSFSTVEGHKSAFVDLFRKHNKEIPKDFEKVENYNRVS
jgi:hypothetical protein